MRPSSDPDENPPDHRPRARTHRSRSPRSAVSSACGPPARTSPTSPTTASTPCSTAGRRPRASPCPTGRRTVVYKDLGLVSQVFDEQVLSSLKGHIAVGHCRYSTTGSTTWENAQPTFRTTAAGSGIALGHNGNLVNTAELRDEVAAQRRSARPARARAPTPTSSPSCSPPPPPTSASRRPRCGCCPRLRGAFSLVFADEQHPLRRPRPARRPPARPRPAGARLGDRQRDGGAGHRRRVVRARGRARRAAGHRRRRHAQLPVRHARSRRAACSSTSTWPAPTPRSPGRSVHATRVEIGRRLAAEHPVEADLVIPMPESGTPAADRLRAGLRHPLRPGPGQERLRRPHVHPASPDHPPARHPAQAQPAARGHPGQAAGRGGRLDRARQHPARDRPDAARGGRARGARPDRVAAGAVAVLLRHRLRHPRRADRQRRWTSRACAARSAPTRWATSPSTA